MAAKNPGTAWERGSHGQWLMLCLQLFGATAILTLAGCSTAPCADFMDFWFPGRYPGDGKGIAGGVCVPQGGPAGGVLGAPPATAAGVPIAAATAGPPGAVDLPPPLPVSQTPTRPGPW